MGGGGEEQSEDFADWGSLSDVDSVTSHWRLDPQLDPRLDPRLDPAAPMFVPAPVPQSKTEQKKRLPVHQDAHAPLENKARARNRRKAAPKPWLEDINTPTFTAPAYETNNALFRSGEPNGHHGAPAPPSGWVSYFAPPPPMWYLVRDSDSSGSGMSS
ncbi:hypothetical protein BDW02DRAFT_574791 [Decorospora gaudefroyi]|uniref:Uncharacterized protein n=1 Tax=Decorospora gaudefroyi TaxID=184978 RepID=A0A6A5K256_9PLEO|nr:hypothetical protein BDW02DRAFT_574791 [Decorospora gaudefroyi]